MSTTTTTDRPAGLRELLGELMARTRWSADRLAAHQREQLDALLRHAVSASPYYRRHLGADPTGAPLDQLPTLSKATLTAHFDEIVTDPRFGAAAVRAHLAGPLGTGPLHDHLVLTTSGSTGEPSVVVCSRTEFAPWVAALLRTMTLLGVTPDMRLAGLGSPSGMHISRHLLTGVLEGRPSTAPRTSAATPLPELVAALNAYRPDVIPGYPSMHALLAQEQLAGRLHIAPKVVPYAGEVLTPDMRDRVREAWDVDPVSMYSTTEAATIASSCTAGAGMHLWEDLALVEVVDEHDRPVPPGTPGHKVLLTNLVNRVQPLIRYEITDMVTVAEGPNPTGMPFRRITAVEGRSDDVVHLPAAAGCGTVAVPPNRLRAPVAATPGLRQYQIVRDRHGLHVAVVLGDGATTGVGAEVRAALDRALHDLGAVPPPISVRVVDAIARESGPAAKLKTVRVQPF